MHIVGPDEQAALEGRPAVEMKTVIPDGETPIASIMIVGTKSGKVFVGHAEGQFHAAHGLCLAGAQTLYEMIKQQLRKDDDRRVMPVPTPLSNIILPPVGGRDS